MIRKCICKTAHFYHAACLLAVLLTLGCGFGGDRRGYEISGTVTFKGEPVPLGNITFSPDAAKGNTGPGSVAAIKDGRYRTEPHQGHGGGAYIVQINGYDGVPIEGGEGIVEEGKALFPPYETRVDLPAENTTHDFDVPGR